MPYSVLPPTSPASISFGERRLGQSALSKTFSLGIGFGQQPSTQRPPYPSPPMTGSSPPESFPSQRLQLDHSPPQERLNNTSRNMRHQSQGSVDINAETLSPIATDESRRSPAVATAISSIHVGRSPFIAQSLGQAQPRKTKSHVASACINCKKAHLACDVRRPCPRCIGLNKQDTCKDVQHRKRGRPRLRDHERTHSFEVNQIGNIPPHRGPPSPLSPPTAAPHSYRTYIHRISKAQAGDPQPRYPRGLNSYAAKNTQPRLMSLFDDRPAQAGYNVPLSGFKALLTVELVIVWSTEQMREFLGLKEHEVQNCMKSLFDIVSPDDRDKLYRLSGKIKDDVHREEPAYLSPPHATVYATIQNTQITEIVDACTRSNLKETLMLRLNCGRRYQTVIRLQVVKTCLFFVMAELASVTDVPQFKASSPTYSVSPLYCGQSTLHPASPPLRQPYPTDIPVPQTPYSVHQNKSLLSQMVPRSRSLHSESIYPSLAQYANSSSISQYRNCNPHLQNTLPPAANLRRHSDQPLASTDLTLPPLRSFGLERPRSAEDNFKMEPVGGASAAPMLKRIAVKDFLH